MIRFLARIIICLTPLLFIGTGALAQYEDHVWVFGQNAGIRFDTATKQPTRFDSGTYCYEVATSVSDSAGNLLLYLSQSPSDLSFSDYYMAIFNSSGQIIENGDSIKCSYTANSGAILVPSPSNPSTHYLYHIGFQQKSAINCGFGICYTLFQTIIEAMPDGTWEVVKKNQSIQANMIEESIGVVKHANGSDYWIFCHMQRDNPSKPGNREILRLLLTPSGTENFGTQVVGSPLLGDNIAYGQYIVSKDGSKVAYAAFKDGLVDMFDFDRCSGIFFHKGSIEIGQGYYPYAGTFSADNKLLYISWSMLGSSSSYIYQHYPDSAQDVYINASHAFISHLKLGPDANIYVCKTTGVAPSSYLGIIPYPESVGPSCGYDENGFYLGDSSKASSGLPNIPNYNLGALPVYMADAGRDTFYCAGDSTIKGFFIGGDSIGGVTYEWFSAPGIDTPSRPQQFVLPAQSRWYYVTITDTNYVGPSCSGRLDSVYVEVRTCVGVKEILVIDSKVYPNPASNELTVELAYAGVFKLYDLFGKEVLTRTITPDQLKSQIDISILSNGLYIYSITSDGSVTHTGKLSIIQN